MMGGVTHLGGLPGLPVRVTLPAGVTICHVNVSRWGNPHRFEVGTPMFKLPNCKRNKNFNKPHPALRGCKIVGKRVLFFDHG